MHDDVCNRILKHGSKSFYLAACCLPKDTRIAAAAVYAFCREADDAVDTKPHQADKLVAIDMLQDRLQRIYAANNLYNPVDVALAHVVQAYHLPQYLFAALLDGFAWDASLRLYDSLEDVEAYSARVAAVVGVIMTLLMGQRNPHVLWRACDLGVAAQLTNIARDVGEDARAGRLYLPCNWLREVGIEPAVWLRAPVFNEGIAHVVQRLLAAADVLYTRSQLGMAYLPPKCRIAIFAARLIYADIGRTIKQLHYDTFNQRAYVSLPRKLYLLLHALRARFWQPQALGDGCVLATRFLVDGIAA